MKAITSQEEQQARTIIGLLDLSTLHIDDDDQRIFALCKRAITPMGEVAAVCVYPRFVRMARDILSQLRAKRVRVGTVANFPASPNMKSAIADMRAALAVGADEIDLVYPYQALLRGDREEATDLVRACRTLCGERATLKVILETGELKDPQLIRMACEDVIAAGVNFVGTSSGKAGLATTPQAARILLQVIADVGGQASIKMAGGIRTFDEALGYLALAQARFGPQWVNADRVRLGAATVLDDVLARLGM